MAVARLMNPDCWGKTTSKVDALFKRGNSGYLEHDLGDFVAVRVAEHSSQLQKQVIDVLARGECGDESHAPDPLLDWCYYVRTKGVYGPLAEAPTQHRQDWFRWMAEYCMHYGCSRRGTYALIEKKSGKVVSAAVTGPPHTVPFGRMSGGEMGLNLRKAGMSMAIEILANNMRLRHLGGWQNHCTDNLGIGDHLYIVMFATAPEYQGRGCGSVLLRFLGKVADTDEVPTVLETAGSRNVSFYANKGGFEEHERGVIGNFKAEGGGVSMMRPVGGGPGKIIGHKGGANEAAASRRRGEVAAGKPSQAPATQEWSAGESAETSGAKAKAEAEAEAEEGAGHGASSSACGRFVPKRRSGPLKSYCRDCGLHYTRCGMKTSQAPRKDFDAMP